MEKEAKNKELCESWSYEFRYWMGTFLSFPIELIESEIGDEDWSMNRFHIFKLENGKYASVYEAGCSCYEPNDAQIELHPNLASAQKLMDNWRKESKHFNY